MILSPRAKISAKDSPKNSPKRSHKNSAKKSTKKSTKNSPKSRQKPRPKSRQKSRQKCRHEGRKSRGNHGTYWAPYKFFINFFTAKSMTVKLSIGLNSKKFRVSLFSKHWTHQTLNECINAALVILPIEKYRLLLKSSFNIQHADFVGVKFFVIFFRRKRMK